MMRARESGVELLCILAMLLIAIGHVPHFYAVTPTASGFGLALLFAPTGLSALPDQYLFDFKALPNFLIALCVFVFVRSRPFAWICCCQESFYAPLMHKGASRG